MIEEAVSLYSLSRFARVFLGITLLAQWSFISILQFLLHHFSAFAFPICFLLAVGWETLLTEFDAIMFAALTLTYELVYTQIVSIIHSLFD